MSCGDARDISEMNQIRVEIRLARETDAAAVSDVLREAFAEYEPLYTDEGFSATTPDAELVLQRMAQGPVWVAAQDNAVIGTVSAVAQGDSLYIRSMGIVPRARGLRIGTLLLEGVEGWARASGHRRLFLSTTPFLARAIALYERHGFARVDQGPYELFGTPLFTMEKKLGEVG